MKDPNAPKIADMENRIALCRQQDIVADGKTMELHRAEVVWTWARIKSYLGRVSFMNSQGFAIIDSAKLSTHAITVRHGLEVEYSEMAWIYEERRKSPPRWYKILGFSDTVGWVTLQARLVERSDDAQVPHMMLLPQSARVEL